MASSLSDGRWDYGASDAAIFASIAVGIPEDGMPGFGAVMDTAQIDALVRLMRDGRARAIPLIPTDSLRGRVSPPAAADIGRFCVNVDY